MASTSLPSGFLSVTFILCFTEILIRKTDQNFIFVKRNGRKCNVCFSVKGVETMVNIVKSDMMSAVCICPLTIHDFFGVLYIYAGTVVCDGDT